jgi:hypothetical protein
MTTPKPNDTVNIYIFAQTLGSPGQNFVGQTAWGDNNGSSITMTCQSCDNDGSSLWSFAGNLTDNIGNSPLIDKISGDIYVDYANGNGIKMIKQSLYDDGQGLFTKAAVSLTYTANKTSINLNGSGTATVKVSLVDSNETIDVHAITYINVSPGTFTNLEYFNIPPPSVTM